jgi:hypothetical protein
MHKTSLFRPYVEQRTAVHVDFAPTISGVRLSIIGLRKALSTYDSTPRTVPDFFIQPLQFVTLLLNQLLQRQNPFASLVPFGNPFRHGVSHALKSLKELGIVVHFFLSEMMLIG